VSPHRGPRAARDVHAYTLPVATAAFLLVGALLRLSPPTREASDAVWLAGLLVTGAPLVWRTAREAFRGRFATDLVATLAILVALPLHQPLAGLVIVLMQSGGEALERYAEGRASAAVRALEEAAPRIAHRTDDAGTRVEDVPVDAIAVGDLLLVRPGELLPCDAEVTAGRSHVDTSSLTGEPIPLSAVAGTRLMSGSTNGEGPLTVRALALASESQYARIVELVRGAQASKAPLQRLADSYAVWFTPLTLLVCAAAWLVSGDAERVLAVLVVATPCPLILATPVAIIGGINRAARRQIIVRNGGALEQLGGLTAAVFDKTGTLTVGEPRVSAVHTAPGFEERDVLYFGGAVERSSSHKLARAFEDAVDAAGIRPPLAHHVTERPGRGVVGVVDGRDVAVGSLGLLLEHHPSAGDDFTRLGGDAHGLRAYVSIDGRAAGIVEYADQLRPGLGPMFAELAALGFRRIQLLSGDHEANVQDVARTLGFTVVYGELLPEDKLASVEQLLAEGHRVMVVGDGTNDAPALSRATVGIALAAHGGGITAEAADVVILADDVGRVTEAVRLGRRTLGIARQSIWVGLGLSASAMVVASLGYIPPVAGALLQEVIDVAVILNALRTSRPGAVVVTPVVRPAAGPAHARDAAEERVAEPAH
jgi:heavy metal translocating P-type ATPase